MIMGLLPAVLLLTSVNALGSVIYQTALGDVEGVVYEIEAGKKVAAFLGVPYAKPPINELRFERPQIVEAWNSTLRCKNFRPSCWYIERPLRSFLPNPRMDEDCLYLNIFTPLYNETTQKAPLPVLLFIHGGGFVMDTAAHFGSKSTASILPLQDVIVVHFNYRLGILGFFATDDLSVPGNQGLWDIKMALDWIRMHISSFNGDPNRITVGGQSAGSMATQLLMMSPHTKDLFQQAIMMSGTSSYPLSPIKSDILYNDLAKYSECLGFKGQPSDRMALVDFYRTVNPDQLAQDIAFMTNNSCGKGVRSWPIFDDDFLPLSWENFGFNQSKIPLIVGVTRNEGLVTLSSITKDTMDESTKDTIRKLFSEKESIVNKVFNTFVTSENTTERLQQCLDIISDLYFNNGIYEFALNASTNSSASVFVYRFDYYRKDGHNNETYPRPIAGSTHCDDLAYLFGTDVNREFHPTAETDIVTQRFSRSFANFVKTGSPRIEPDDMVWEEVKPETGKVSNLIIDLPMSLRNDDLFDGRAKIWQNLRSSSHIFSSTFPVIMFFLGLQA